MDASRHSGKSIFLGVWQAEDYLNATHTDASSVGHVVDAASVQTASRR